MQDKTGKTAAVVRPDPIILGVAGLLTIAMLACGERTTETPTVQAAPVTPAPSLEIRDVPPTEITPVERRVATYAGAEEAYRGRRYGEAVELFESYVTSRPQNPFGHYMLGLSAWKSGQPERAESAFLAALELDPGHVKSQLNLTRVLLDLGRGEDALVRVRSALELDPENVDAHRLMGRVLTTTGRPAEALESYRAALSIDSTDTWSMNNMGLILIRIGSYEEALRPLARAVELQPGVAIFQNNLGAALERTGRFSDAVVAYRSARDADGGHAAAGVSLARVERLREKPDQMFVSLEHIALAFADEVRSWSETRARREHVEAAGLVVDP
jgi:Flp pilus assembly protein TadD